MSKLKDNLKDLFSGCVTVPNFLSLIRILLIPVFAVLFLKDHFVAAVIVIIVAELTDLIDGAVARKFNQVSALGKLLDPIADKLSQMAIVIVLIVKYWENAIKYLFMFFIAKEILMLIGGAILISKGKRPVAAEMWGKVATTVFCIVMILVLALGENGALCDYIGFTLPSAATWVLVSISAVCTLCSLLGYIPGFVRALKENEIKEKPLDE
ncbi:MAG: CDP-alcohol phosphatidyltransferase family protein [Clostridiales bacterium]|nr:CDP-alcohol phosphatidyltransferase family protein [Clostridiales bacterium]